jgi:hypothetical protein
MGRMHLANALPHHPQLVHRRILGASGMVDICPHISAYLREQCRAPAEGPAGHGMEA